MVSKPKNWYSNKKERKVSPEAKSYLSFKLKQYYRTRKIEVSEVQEQPQREEDFPIRVWAKFRYTGNNPLFIEAFIDGMYSRQGDMEDLLYDKVREAFNEDIANNLQFGSERIPSENGSMEIRYKSSVSSRWSYLR